MPATNSSKTTTDLRTQMARELNGFKAEARDVLETLVLPNWGTDRHGFTHTLYGYMMRAFFYVDLLSAYWTGPGQPQSESMVDFMDRFMGYDRRAHSVAVQLWRHKLMHTASPRKLTDPVTGKTVYWLLHWYEHLPRIRHFTISDAGHQMNLNLGAIYLIEDIERATNTYFDELAQSLPLQRNANAMEGELDSYSLRSI